MAQVPVDNNLPQDLLEIQNEKRVPQRPYQLILAFKMLWTAGDDQSPSSGRWISRIATGLPS
jgi:hypothetical protein